MAVASSAIASTMLGAQRDVVVHLGGLAGVGRKIRGARRSRQAGVYCVAKGTGLRGEGGAVLGE